MNNNTQQTSVGLTILIGLGFVGLLVVIVSGISLASSMAIV
jgi:hypothetical protein